MVASRSSLPVEPKIRINRVKDLIKSLGVQSSAVDELVKYLEAVAEANLSEKEYQRTELELKLPLLEFIVFKYQMNLQEAQGDVNKLKQENAEIQELAARLRSLLENPPIRFGFFQWLELPEVTNGFPRVFIRAENGSLLGAHADRNEDLIKALKEARVGHRVRYVEVKGAVVVVALEHVFEQEGSLVTVNRMLSEGRVEIELDNGEHRIAFCSTEMSQENLNPGDKVLLSRSGLVTQKMQSAQKIKELVLESSPDVRWTDIGGLGPQIEELRQKIETSFLYPQVVEAFDRPNNKGALLIGAPGVGKTLIAKAMVTEMARHLSQRTGRDIKGYHVLVNGPADVLRGIIGHSEGRLQAIFSEPKKVAAEGHLVLIIFDECEGLFPVRSQERLDAGSGNKLVTQLNAEMDGIKGLSGVMVVGLTNRQDLIDPAVLRRFDIKVHVPRPDRAGAKEIFHTVIKETVPLHPKYFAPENYEGGLYYPRDERGQRRADKGEKIGYDLARDRRKVIEYFAEKLVASCYDGDRQENQYFRLVYRNGREQIFTFANFMSGDRISKIVNEAKDIAIKRLTSLMSAMQLADHSTGGEVQSQSQYLALACQQDGLKLKDLYEALDKVFRSEGALPTTPEAMQSWLEVEGFRVDEIDSIKVMKQDAKQKESAPARGGPARRSSSML